MFSRRTISLVVVLSLVAQAMVLINTETHTSNFVEDSSPLEQVPEYGEARGSPSNRSVPFTNLGVFNHIPSFVFTNGKIMIYQTESDNVSYGGFGKGRELYVSDGTLTGTSMIKDLNPDGGSIDSIYSYVDHAWWNDVLYLELDDGTDETGQELWRTDGTAAGTYIVKDIRPGSTASGIAGLTLWKDHLYFTAYDGNQSHGYELWQSDGTENGTFILKDIYPGDQWTDSGWPSYFTVFNDKLYFQATDEENGAELWTTDGTENGTTLVVDIRPGTMGNGKGYPSSPASITVFNDYMYFSATNDTVSKALWKSDGTANGTSLVKDIYPGGNSNVRAIVPSNLETSGSSPDRFGIMGDHFYFTAKSSCSSSRCANLWKSDGTEDGTVALTDFDDDSNGESVSGIMYNRIGFVIGESKMIFVVDNETYDEELWISDGTTEGTHLLIDINPDGDSDIYSAVAGSGDIFYFGAKDGNWCSHCEEHPNVLWKTDGTEEGTVKINSTRPKPSEENYPENIGYTGYPLFRFGNHLVFEGHTECGSSGGDNHPGCEFGFWILHNISSGFSPTPSYTLYKGKVMDSITFDYDGEGATWDTSPDLPAGLSFDSNGTITGTPTELLSRTYYTVYANGTSDQTYQISISVVEPDTDGDGVLDINDAFPFDAAASVDTDGDGKPDTLNGDSTSEPPLVEDLDDDDDGYNDTVEIAEGSDPLDVESTPLDTDGDFDPDSTDPDDDGDGYDDTVEISEGSDPLDIESIPVDTDGDFDPDSTDPDDDGDGYDDGNDTFPLDKDEWLDNDEDGIGDNADSDDDNDGLDDIVEDANGNGTVDEGETDPLDPDTDDDGYCDGPVNVTINEVLICEVEDRDGDGIADDFDAFPDDINEWEDTDGDEIGNNADPDDDGDGYNDTVEVAEGSDPLNFTSTPLDTDGDFDPDSTDPDDDGDGFDDGDDVFPTNSAEWLDTDDDGTGNNADTDDDGDGLSDEDEATLGSDPLIVDTDADGIPDNWDPLPTDPNGDFDKDGKLDSEEYNPALDGTPADEDGDGTNDMLQVEATPVQAGSTSVSQNRSWAENCCLILLLLLLLLIPLLIRKYNNSLIYEPNPVTRVLGDNMPELRMVPSLHEYTRKYIKRTNSDGLRRVRYAVSGDLLAGLDIDSRTGIISGYPEKAGTYTYEVVMKHSNGKFKGEVQIEVVEKGKAEEADEVLERGRKLLEEIEAEESKAKEEEVEAKDEAPDPKQAGLDRIAAKAETIDFGIIGTASASDKDNLKLLKGIGPFIEEKLNALGIYKIEQIAKMTSELEDEVNLAIEFFPGRVKRDEWVNQAKELSK